MEFRLMTFLWGDKEFKNK